MLSSLFDFATVNKDTPCSAAAGTKKSPFRLPIEYIEANKPVPETVLQDLELVAATNNNNHSESMSHHLYDPQTVFATRMAKPMMSFYTTDTAFLRDTQHIVQQLTEKKQEVSPPNYKEDVLLKMLDDLADDELFMDKYYYLEWESLASFNRSSTFLQAISVLNGVVPLANIVMTVLILFLPLMVMTLQGQSWCMANYLSGLRTYGRDNIFTHVFSVFDSTTEVNFQTGIMLLTGVVLYAYQLYYNIHYTMRFYSHLREVVDNLLHTRAFLQQSERKMTAFLDVCAEQQTKSYREFVGEVQRRLLTVRILLQKLGAVRQVGLDADTLMHMGYHFECYYLLYAEEDYVATLLYCMDFDGYMDNLACVGRRVATGILHAASFDKPRSETEEAKSEAKSVVVRFEGMYYPPFVKNLQGAVRNDVDFTSANAILTGPNASGKTTFLKTTAINILVTQQVGCGFYESACMEELYSHVHSYINIPDTSERDSLFEAETRRCKEILTRVEEGAGRHFCLFDELFSGTNPEEATQSALSYLRYLAKQPRVHFLLTTHYVDVCKRIDGLDRVVNWRTVVKTEDKDRLEMTYLVEPGISEVQGAFFILGNMGFPQEIMDDLRSLEPILEEKEEEKEEAKEEEKEEAKEEEKEEAKEEEKEEAKGEEVIDTKPTEEVFESIN